MAHRGGEEKGGEGKIGEGEGPLTIIIILAFYHLIFSPLQRSRSDVKQLAQHLMELMHFVSYDKTVTKEDFYTGLANRAILESLPSSGYSSELLKNCLFFFLNCCVSCSTRERRVVHSSKRVCGKIVQR